MKKLGVIAVVALAGVAFAAGCKKDNEENEAAETAAQAPATPGAPAAFTVEAPDSRRALARISLDSPSKLALARVPAGPIEKVELERENDALIWSFDIKVAGNAGIEEVAVNALTGAVGATEHEDAAAETREAREDSAAARRPAAPPRRP